MNGTPYSTSRGIVFRDAKGRILPGSAPGPGRKRGLDFRRLVIEQCGKRGRPLEEDLWGVYLVLLQRALAGDVPAAKLLLERLTDPVPKQVDLKHTMDTAGNGPPVPTGRDFGRELREVLRIAEDRGMMPPEDGGGEDYADILGEE